MFNRQLAGYLFILPSMLFLLVFVIYPILSAFYLSFHRYNLITDVVVTGRRFSAELPDPQNTIPHSSKPNA